MYRKIRCDSYCSTFWENYLVLNKASVAATPYSFLPFSNYSYLAVQLNSLFRLSCLYSVSTSLLAAANAYFFLPFSIYILGRSIEQFVFFSPSVFEGVESISRWVIE